MLKRIKNKALFTSAVLTAAFVMVAFQNCSNTSFGGVEGSSGAQNGGALGNNDPNAPPVSGNNGPIQPGGRTCQSVSVITPVNGVIEVPARSNGVCYIIKLADRIANSSSQLTTSLDADVTSRNHDNNGASTRNPYVLAYAKVNIKLQGPRDLVLSGAADSTTNILVDNFILAGIYPQSLSNPSNAYFMAAGTEDSTLPGTNYISFRGQALTLTSFGAGGTSTIAPVKINSAAVPTNQVYSLELRALDCGSVRELSSIYLLFE